MVDFFYQTGLLPHVFGLCALILSVSAWQLKSSRHIILFYVPIGFFWALQYYYLGAYAALVTCCLSMCKDAFVGLLPTKYGRYAIFAYLVAAVIILFKLMTTWIDLLPLVATCIMNFGLLFPDNRKLIARAGISHQFVWMTYNIPAGAWMSLACSTFVVISTFIGMMRHEKWQLGKCYRTFFPSLVRSLFPNLRTYP